MHGRFTLLATCLIRLNARRPLLTVPDLSSQRPDRIPARGRSAGCCPCIPASARFSSALASTSRWFVGSSRRRIFVSGIQLILHKRTFACSPPLRVPAPGSQYAVSSDRILQVQQRTSYCVHDGKQLPYFLDTGRRIFLVRFLFKITDLLVVTTRAHFPENGGARPRMLFRSVVFPIPFAPTRAIFSLRSMPDVQRRVRVVRHIQLPNPPSQRSVFRMYAQYGR